MKMNVCAAGDIELFERIPEDFDYDAITDIIKQCDVRITDLEAPVVVVNG